MFPIFVFFPWRVAGFQGPLALPFWSTSNFCFGEPMNFWAAQFARVVWTICWKKCKCVGFHCAVVVLCLQIFSALGARFLLASFSANAVLFVFTLHATGSNCFVFLRCILSVAESRLTQLCWPSRLRSESRMKEGVAAKLLNWSSRMRAQCHMM